MNNSNDIISIGKDSFRTENNKGWQIRLPTEFETSADIDWKGKGLGMKGFYSADTALMPRRSPSCSRRKYYGITWGSSIPSENR